MKHDLYFLARPRNSSPRAYTEAPSLMFYFPQCLRHVFGMASTIFLMQDDKAIGRNVPELLLGIVIMRKTFQPLIIFSEVPKQDCGIAWRQEWKNLSSPVVIEILELRIAVKSIQENGESRK